MDSVTKEQQASLIKRVQHLKLNDEKKKELIKIISTVFEMIKEGEK
jgi:hypothetical protein